MRVKSGQLYQLEALGISAELKAKVCWIPFSVSASVSVLLSPSLLVLEFISTHGNIEREATKTHIVGILFEFLINLWWEAGVCSALCWLLPFWYWSWNTRWGWGNSSTLIQTSHVHILRTLVPYKYMTRALQFVACMMLQYKTSLNYNEPKLHVSWPSRLWDQICVWLAC